MDERQGREETREKRQKTRDERREMAEKRREARGEKERGGMRGKGQERQGEIVLKRIGAVPRCPLLSKLGLLGD